MDNQKIAKHPRTTLCDPTVARNSNRGGLTGANCGKDIEFYATSDSVGQLISVDRLEQAKRRHLRSLFRCA
jgi:hypothetical protein